MDSNKLRASCFGAILSAAWLAPAQAAFLINGGSDSTLPVTGNDYNADLQALGFDRMRTGGYLTVDQNGFVDFYFIGAESTYSDTFTATEHPSMITSSITEPADNDNGTNPMTPFDFNGVTGFSKIRIAVTAGERLDFQFSNSFDTKVVDNTKGFLSGRLFDLGIVYDLDASLLNEVVLAYDDQLSLIKADDNHDDMLIRATFVPIPAAVWLFGSGLLGLVGIARRKRSS